jgi:hypothetical protein
MNQDIIGAKKNDQQPPFSFISSAAATLPSIWKQPTGPISTVSSFGNTTVNTFGLSNTSSFSSFSSGGEAPKFSGDPLAMFASKPLVSFSTFAASGTSSSSSSSSTTTTTTSSSSSLVPDNAINNIASGGIGGATGKRTRAEISRGSDADVDAPSSQNISEAPVRAALAASSLESSALEILGEDKDDDTTDKKEEEKEEDESETDTLKESERKRALHDATETIVAAEAAEEEETKDDGGGGGGGGGDGGDGGDDDDFEAHNDRLLKESAGYSIFATPSTFIERPQSGSSSSSSSSKGRDCESKSTVGSAVGFGTGFGSGTNVGWTLGSSSSSSSSSSSMTEAKAADHTVVYNGEEGELTILELRARLFTLTKERVKDSNNSSSSSSSLSTSTTPSWKDCGIGILRINVRRDLVNLLPERMKPKGLASSSHIDSTSAFSGPSARIVMRQESHANSGSGTRLLLNAHLYKSFPVSLHASATDSITFSALPVPSETISFPSGKEDTLSSSSSTTTTTTSSSSLSSIVPQPYLLRFQKQALAETMLSTICAARELDITGER